MTNMDWILFWTAFGAIGGTFGAIATAVAVVVALWQTKYSQQKKIKIFFSDRYALCNQNSGETINYVGVTASNVGNRKVIISNWGIKLKEYDVFAVTPSDAIGLEKMAYVKLPLTLDIEEKVDLQWQKDRFELFLKANEKNIEKNKPLTFFVQDSTGKRYKVKTKETASHYMK